MSLYHQRYDMSRIRHCLGSLLDMCLQDLHCIGKGKVMAKQRQHNEWFRPVSLGNRKSCPECHVKLAHNESIWSWGQYVNAKWRTIKYFCKECWPAIRGELNEHTGDCGCVVNLQMYHCTGPDWLSLEECHVPETPVSISSV